MNTQTIYEEWRDQAQVQTPTNVLSAWDLLPLGCYSIHQDIPVKTATIKTLTNLGITSRESFDKWKVVKGGGKKRIGQQAFYVMVKKISPTHWASLKSPESAVRWAYEAELPGFKIHQ
jgi:hypothetical protein